MGWLRKLALAVGALVALVVVAYLVGILQAPSAGVADIGDWGDVSEERTEVITTLWVDNPNPIGASVGSGLTATYHIDLNGVRLATGEKEGVTIATGNNSVELTTAIENENLQPWWVSYVERNETIDVTAGGDITVDAGLTATASIPPIERTLLADETPVIDALSAAANETAGTYTVSTSDVAGGTPVDRSVGYEIERGWATWGDVSAEQTTVRFRFRIHNPGDVAVPPEPDGLRANVEMNDVELFTADGEALSLRSADRPIEPGETRVVTYTVTMDNDKVDDWFRSHVRNSEQTEMETSLQLVYRPAIIDREIAIPAEGPTVTTCDIQTAILVDDQETETTCSGPAGVVETGQQTDATAETTTSEGPIEEITDTPTLTASAPSPGDVTGTTVADGGTTADADTTTEREATPAPPVADATADPTSGEVPLTVNFDASGSTDPNDDIAEYVWRFDDGSPPTRGQQVEHTFTRPGDYTVEVTVVDEQSNRDTATVQITVEDGL